ncbi:MAG: cation:proton antiporter, partial [Mycobacteriales bacterium]
FVLALVGGVAVGLAVAVVLAAVRRRISDPLADNAISLATPYLAFLPAEAVHGSGVLAVVVAGLWFAHQGPSVQGGEARLQSRAVWTFVEYLLEGFAFILVGQQLPSVLRALHHFSASSTAFAAVATVGGVLLARLVWLVVSEGLPARFRTRLAADRGDRHRHLQPRDLTVLWWSGTRGVITLAAAFSIPLTLDSGRAFPDRPLLLFCGYLVVVVTLVGQGSTYALVVRRLAYPQGTSVDAVARNEARIAAVQAALRRLDQLGEDGSEPPDDVITSLREAAARRLQRYEARVNLLSSPEESIPHDPYRLAVRLRRLMIDAEREELVRWRDTGRLSDRNLRILQRELDHEEGLLPNI